MTERIETHVEERVPRPANEVFAAIVDPAQMSRYFITGGSGPMQAGKAVDWEFADVDARVRIDVIEVVENRKVVYEGTHTGSRTRVTLSLAEVDRDTTLVTAHETGWPMDSDGVKRALGQTAGWTYFLCCLKAYLQHGINLRQGLKRRLTEQ
jgi:uncharacterized protein YndB with AHSA1/START domain